MIKCTLRSPASCRYGKFRGNGATECTYNGFLDCKYQYDEEKTARVAQENQRARAEDWRFLERY